MPDVSIIIVTWNSEKEILACLESVVVNISYLPNHSIELIIIDNNSSDETINIVRNLKYSSIQIFRNSSNLGYTKAANHGIINSNGEYVFLLNPDTILYEDCLENLLSFLENNAGYAAACPRLVNEDGSVQQSIRNFPGYASMLFEFSLLAYIFPKSKMFNNWRMGYFDYNNDSDVLQPMAAALLIKKEVLEKKGNMDECFKMFFNDVDLCKKIAEFGSKIRYLKDAGAVHKKGASVYKNRIEMIKVWNKDCIAYFGKYHNNKFLLLWLKLNLKLSSVVRILYYILTKK
jgi:GT2 family glycosyltransferase